MRAPSDLDSIVASIVDDLSPDDADRFTNETDVRGIINLLQSLDKPIGYRGNEQKSVPFRGWRSENAKDAAALLKQIKRLQKTIAETNSPALFLLFSGEDEISDRIPPRAVQRRMLQRLRLSKSMLESLKQRCEFLLTKRPGVQGEGYRQHRVAQEAWRLLRRCGHKPAHGSSETLYARVAEKLWEALTGEVSKDLQWACKLTLQLAKEGKLTDSE